MANFTISQAVDGSTITITDTRATPTTYVITLTTSAMGSDYTDAYTLTLSSDQRTSLATGLSLEVSDFENDEGGNYPYDTWLDGVYTFNIDRNSAGDEKLVKAFMEIAAGEVFANALNYRLYLDTKEKSAILEQMRLLNNMGYAAEIGSTTAFSENLELLQDLLE